MRLSTSRPGRAGAGRRSVAFPFSGKRHQPRALLGFRPCPSHPEGHSSSWETDMSLPRGRGMWAPGQPAAAVTLAGALCSLSCGLQAGKMDIKTLALPCPSHTAKGKSRAGRPWVPLKPDGEVGGDGGLRRVPQEWRNLILAGSCARLCHLEDGGWRTWGLTYPPHPLGWLLCQITKFYLPLWRSCPHDEMRGWV